MMQVQKHSTTQYSIAYTQVHLKWKQIPIGQKEIIIQINSIFFLNMTLSTWTKIEPKFNVQNLSFKISSMPKFIE